MSDRNAQVARGAGILLPAKVVGSGLALWLDVLVNGAVGNDGYGVYATTRRILTFVFLLVLLGTENAVVRWVSQAVARGDDATVRGTFRRVSVVTGGAGALVGAVAFVGAEPLAALIDPDPRLAAAFRWVALTIPLAALRSAAVSTSQGLFVLTHRALVMDLLWPLVALVAVVALAPSWGLEGVFVALDLSMVVGTVVALVLVGRLRRDLYDPRARASLDSRALFAFAAPLWVYTFVHGIYAWVDQVLLAALGGLEAAGAYGPVAAIAPLFGLGLTALNGIFAPMLAELHSTGQTGEIARMYRTVTRWAVALAVPGVAVAVGAPERVMALWPDGQASAHVALQVAALGQLVGVSVGSVNFLLIMSGHQRQVLYNGVPAIAVNLALCAALIPAHGVTGAALANGLSIALSSLLGLAQVWWLLRVHPLHAGLLRPLFAGVVSVGVAAALGPLVATLPPLVGVALLGAATGLAFSAVLVALGLDAEDRELLGRVVRKLRRK